ncbi:MAG: bifunctional phosphopantothenoylcysteine decarboxylase/phosphopantothenate--cysteine ligase CoaBC [Vulcanimicrobiaceae bacterium]
MDSKVTGARVLLCVSGGIAAYKAAALTSTLVQRGAVVDVAMTAHAERFVTALTFSALTARPVYTTLWDAPEQIPHIRLVRQAQVALLAPATANMIAKLAHGIADDLVSTLLLAARIPVLIAPAMNEAMYEDAATQANLAILRARGYELIEPERGFLAEREYGTGRLAGEERILAALDVALLRSRSLAGKRVLITAGPTREAFDPVRFISNASTGAMGIALAREARARGAEVTLILGPTLLEPPGDVATVRVTTACRMYDAALAQGESDLIIATAAVADWRPAETSPSKRKKGDEDLVVRMVRNPDVLAALAARRRAFVVGFAAETDDHEPAARAKCAQKGLDAIAVNDVSGERGFGPGENALVLLWGQDGRLDLGRASKPVLAARLLDEVGVLMAARHGEA